MTLRTGCWRKPFQLERNNVDNDAAAGMRGFAKAGGEHAARDDAAVAPEIDEGFFVDILGSAMVLLMLMLVKILNSSPPRVAWP
jgi:hypothetical protein